MGLFAENTFTVHISKDNDNDNTIRCIYIFRQFQNELACGCIKILFCFHAYLSHYGINFRIFFS